MSKSILVIDDDIKLNQLLSEYLGKYGYEVTTAAHPEEGLKILRRELPDIVILDVMLPEMDGFEVCKRIRSSFDVPIIMLTARGDVTDRIVGLELGADDYLPKPFEPRELVARMQSILRRSGDAGISQRMHVGALIVDMNALTATLEGEQIELTTAEFALLSLFVRNPGKMLTRDRIMDNLKGYEWESFDRSIDVLVSRLRQKLHDDPRKPRFIKTVWGAGYKFIGAESET
jgi:DNA-binding response OmpR family regulator